jgi:NodT family efflux transporter outer membrane factor (OMF) lipoprotein
MRRAAAGSRRRTAPTLSLMLMLAGCNLAPHYDRPAQDTGARFKEAVHGDAGGEGWQLATPRDTARSGRWWEAFGDAQLDALEARVAISNQTVAAAEANYRAAVALAREAQASLYPTLSLAPAATRSRSSAAIGSLGGAAAAGATVGTGAAAAPAAGGGTTTATTTTIAGSTSTAPHNLFTLPLQAAYQLDIWGSIRNTVAQNRFAAQASSAQVQTALLSTQTQLAQDYFQLRVADEQRRILETTVADYDLALRLVRALFDNGLDSDADVASAEAQLENARAQQTDVGVSRAQYEHAIAVLIGVPPSQFSIPYRRLAQTLPAVPVGMPADLLERRADIAAAERAVAQSNAAIGVARAAFFPTLSLTASAGYEATAVGRLFDWPNRFWSVGPALAQSLFDGGERRAATAQARALNDQAVANYRETVLGAIQAVEDNLASLRILAQELVQQHRATVAARRSVQLALVLYRSGLDSYVNVITAQNAFLTSREAELQVQLKQLTASVNLIDNLGGGWSQSEWRDTELLALHPPGSGGEPSVPAQDAGPGGVNPPALPPGEAEPDDFMQLDADPPSAVPPSRIRR